MLMDVVGSVLCAVCCMATWLGPAGGRGQGPSTHARPTASLLHPGLPLAEDSGPWSELQGLLQVPTHGQEHVVPARKCYGAPSPDPRWPQPDLRAFFSARRPHSVQPQTRPGHWGPGGEGHPAVAAGHQGARQATVLGSSPKPEARPCAPGSPLPIWPCRREGGGRPEPTASLRPPWECRPWLEPLCASAPGPRFMFWVGGCGRQEGHRRTVNSEKTTGSPSGTRQSRDLPPPLTVP